MRGKIINVIYHVEVVLTTCSLLIVFINFISITFSLFTNERQNAKFGEGIITFVIFGEIL